MFDTFHLPGVPRPAAAPHPRHPRLALARLTPELLAAQADALRAARRRHLADRPVGQVVEAIDHVAARLLDPADELRALAEEHLPAVTGYSLPMVRHGLDRMAPDWRAPALRRLLREELGDPLVLDGFQPRPHAGGRQRAYGREVVAHVFSGNVPGVAVTSLVRALLVKAASLGKTASREPVLPVLFARGLAEADPGLGGCLALACWPGGDEALTRALLAPADAAVVYGGEEAVAGVRALAPPSARLLVYGPKLSFGVVAREALEGAGAREVAERAALDVSVFDQQGCVSPHLFYVEEGGEATPERWAELLAAALARVEAELPRGAVGVDESSAIHRERAAAEFGAIGGRGTVLHASAGGTAWTVIYDPDPAFSASCLNRLVRVKPVAELDAVPPRLAGVGHLLQTVGVAGPPARAEALAEALGRLGASRVTPVGRMAWPPASWHHDGRPPLADLLRWCDLEG